MNEYHKIHTIYKRDETTKFKTLLMGDYSLPEFRYLARNEWVYTEKVDGTNIRVMLKEGNITFGGKTDQAQIPAELVNRLTTLFLDRADILSGMFPSNVCLYGEGYGAKIQKGGGLYSPTQDFVLFDVRVGVFWLRRPDVDIIAGKLGIKSVPVVEVGTLDDMVTYVQSRPKSTWGDFEMEGVVARPAEELLTRGGQRIITKLKVRDFNV